MCYRDTNLDISSRRWFPWSQCGNHVLIYQLDGWYIKKSWFYCKPFEDVIAVQVYTLSRDVIATQPSSRLDYLGQQRKTLKTFGLVGNKERKNWQDQEMNKEKEKKPQNPVLPDAVPLNISFAALFKLFWTSTVCNSWRRVSLLFLSLWFWPPPPSSDLGPLRPLVLS